MPLSVPGVINACSVECVVDVNGAPETADACNVVWRVRDSMKCDV